MVEMITTYLNKGVLIGVIAAFLKGGVDLKTSAFKVSTFVGDILLCVLIGYSMWELMEGSGLANWSKWLLTIIMSINGFFIVTFLMNVKFIMLGVRVILFRDKKSMDDLVNAYSISHGLNIPPMDMGHVDTEYAPESYNADYEGVYVDDDVEEPYIDDVDVTKRSLKPVRRK